MGSFRSLTTRQAGDTAQFTEGLEPGEWIRYWTRLPHSAAQAISSAAAKPDIDRRGRILGIDFDSGKAAAKRLSLGIIDWHILDEDGNSVEWNVAQAATLLDGLPTGVVDALTKVIGAGDPQPSLEDILPSNGDGPEEAAGEDFAASSTKLLAATGKRRRGSKT